MKTKDEIELELAINMYEEEKKAKVFLYTVMSMVELDNQMAMKLIDNLMQYRRDTHRFTPTKVNISDEDATTLLAEMLTYFYYHPYARLPEVIHESQSNAG